MGGDERTGRPAGAAGGTCRGAMHMEHPKGSAGVAAGRGGTIRERRPLPRFGRGLIITPSRQAPRRPWISPVHRTGRRASDRNRRPRPGGAWGRSPRARSEGGAGVTLFTEWTSREDAAATRGLVESHLGRLVGICSHLYAGQHLCKHPCRGVRSGEFCQPCAAVAILSRLSAGWMSRWLEDWPDDLAPCVHGAPMVVNQPGYNVGQQTSGYVLVHRRTCRRPQEGGHENAAQNVSMT